MTNVVHREPLGVDDYAPPQETAPQDITGKPYPAVKPFYPPKEGELQFPNQLQQPTAEEQRERQMQQASVQTPTIQEQLSQWAKQRNPQQTLAQWAKQQGQRQ